MVRMPQLLAVWRVLFLILSISATGEAWLGWHDPHRDPRRSAPTCHLGHLASLLGRQPLRRDHGAAPQRKHGGQAGRQRAQLGAAWKGWDWRGKEGC